MEVRELLVQEEVRRGELSIIKVQRDDNVADGLTEHVDRSKLEKYMSECGFTDMSFAPTSETSEFFVEFIWFNSFSFIFCSHGILRNFSGSIRIRINPGFGFTLGATLDSSWTHLYCESRVGCNAFSGPARIPEASGPRGAARWSGPNMPLDSLEGSSLGVTYLS